MAILVSDFIRLTFIGVAAARGKIEHLYNHLDAGIGLGSVLSSKDEPRRLSIVGRAIPCKQTDLRLFGRPRNSQMTFTVPDVGAINE